MADILHNEQSGKNITDLAQSFAGAKTLSDTSVGTTIAKFTAGTAGASTTDSGVITAGTQTLAGNKILSNPRTQFGVGGIGELNVQQIDPLGNGSSLTIPLAGNQYSVGLVMIQTNTFNDANVGSHFVFAVGKVYGNTVLSTEIASNSWGGGRDVSVTATGNSVTITNISGGSVAMRAVFIGMSS